jgi:hypothetical protein
MEKDFIVTLHDKVNKMTVYDILHADSLEKARELAAQKYNATYEVLEIIATGKPQKPYSRLSL